MSTEKQKRAEQANAAIRVIADHGRRFFFNKGKQAYAGFEVDTQGLVWFTDDYTRLKINIGPRNKSSRWLGFSHGGTLRDLVEQLYDFIATGQPISRFYLGPERAWSDGNVWGYPTEDMEKVRDMAGALPVFHQVVNGVQP